MKSWCKPHHPEAYIGSQMSITARHPRHAMMLRNSAVSVAQPEARNLLTHDTTRQHRAELT